MNAKPVVIFFGAFAVFGVLFAAVAYFTWQTTQERMDTGIQTRGVVIENSHSRNKQGGIETMVAPVVRFTIGTGQSITYRSQTYEAPPRFNVGDSVALWYQPSNPQDVVLEGADSWLLPMIFGILGAVFFLIGVLGVVFMLRRMRGEELKMKN